MTASNPAPWDLVEQAIRAADGITLPYPPSLNRYYRHVGRKVLISREGRVYHRRVVAALRGAKPRDGDLLFTVALHPPDRRRRDVDNTLKCLLDSLVHARAMRDDSQIKLLVAAMGAPDAKNPRAEVSILEIPNPE